MNVIITEGLLKHLKEQFPNRLPERRNFELRDVDRAAGSQDVIRYLETLYERQNPTEELLNVLQPRHS